MIKSIFCTVVLVAILSLIIKLGMLGIVILFQYASDIFIKFILSVV